MATIYTIMVCIWGQCHIDANAPVLRTLAECRAEQAHAQQVMRNARGVRYVCVRKMVPAWQPAG